jgi:hypothetical protein
MLKLSRWTEGLAERLLQEAEDINGRIGVVGEVEVGIQIVYISDLYTCSKMLFLFISPLI